MDEEGSPGKRELAWCQQARAGPLSNPTRRQETGKKPWVAEP